MWKPSLKLLVFTCLLVVAATQLVPKHTTLQWGVSPAVAPTPKPIVTPKPVEITLLMFHASWCGPCKASMPAVEELAASVKVTKYDIDEHPDLARQYNVTAVPTFVLERDGKEFFRTHDIDEIAKRMSLSMKDFTNALADNIAARSLTTCSRWAQYRRIMAGDFSGNYSWLHHPWVKEMHDSWVPYTWIMKGAQLGVTEVGINRALYTIDSKKRDVLYLMPTMGAASDFSKSRLGPALSLSPYLDSIFEDTNAVNLKRAGNNCLYIRGTRGRTNLLSIPVSELILDEVDRMDKQQLAMALERLSGQLVKHVWGISTPTVPDHGIHTLYKTTTQEHFMFKCPRCGRRTELVWPECVEICGEYATDPNCQRSFLKCKECGGRLEQQAKPEFLSGAEWVPTALNANPDFRGMHISQLYSFTVSPAELVIAHFAGRNDEFAAKEFHNSKLGMPFVAPGARVTAEMIEAAIRDHSMDGLRPQRSGRLITMGVDQGENESFIVICEWLFDRELGPDLGESAICKVLWVGKFFGEDWDRLDQLMSEFQVLYAVVDADPNVNEARRFCRRFNGYASTTRYRAGNEGNEMTVKDGDSGAPMVQVDRTSWLGKSLSRFKQNPARVWLPRDVPEEFCTHVKNLTRTVEKNAMGEVIGVYINTGADHFAHAFCYANIALGFAPLDTSKSIKSI
jgi:thiol-disulfide isomerase/thioredoxin